MFEYKNIVQNKKKRIIVSKKNKYKEKGNYILEDTIYKNPFSKIKIKIGENKITGDKVVIKIIYKQNNLLLSKIKKNIEIRRHLYHMNILQLFEIIETNNKLYIISEYCNEGTLSNYILKRKSLSEKESCKYFQQIINCLEYLDLSNIYDFYIKPENIYLDNENKIKISILSSLNDYAINEKDSYNNIYYCGIILYTMLLGKPPVDEENKTIKKIIYPDDISKEAIDLINNMINLNSKNKYGFKEVKSHPWFNLVKAEMRPGILYKINCKPIDDDILDKIEMIGYNKILCKKSILDDKYDSLMAIYLLTLKKSIKEGKKTIADLFSEKFVAYINDPINWIDKSKINDKLYNIYDISKGYNNNNYNNNFDKHLNNLYNLDIPNQDEKKFLKVIRKRNKEKDYDLINEYSNSNDFSSRKMTLNNEVSLIKPLKNENNNQDYNNYYTTINIEEKDLSNLNCNLILSKNKYIKGFTKIRKNPKIQKRTYFKLKENKNIDQMKTTNIDKKTNKRILGKKLQLTYNPSKVNKSHNYTNENLNESSLMNNYDKKTLQSNNGIEFNSLNENDLQKFNLNDANLESYFAITPLNFFDFDESENEFIIAKDDKSNLSINFKDRNYDYNSLNQKKFESDLVKNHINITKNKTEKKNQRSLNSEDSILPLEPLDSDIKNKLKKKLMEDIINFEKDLKTLNDIKKFNTNDNPDQLNLLSFSDRLIKTTIFNHYFEKQNKENKRNGTKTKFNILEKYKYCLELMSKLNFNYTDKSVDFNLEINDKFLNDKDDKILSKNLLKNQYLSNFIKKLKISYNKKRNKRAKSNDITNIPFFDYENNLNKTHNDFYYNTLNPKCELNNIIIKQIPNAYLLSKYDHNKLNKHIKSNSLRSRLINRYSLLKSFDPNTTNIKKVYNNNNKVKEKLFYMNINNSFNYTKAKSLKKN